jgi:hypothetical protein
MGFCKTDQKDESERKERTTPTRKTGSAVYLTM